VRCLEDTDPHTFGDRLRPLFAAEPIFTNVMATVLAAPPRVGIPAQCPPLTHAAGRGPRARRPSGDRRPPAPPAARSRTRGRTSTTASRAGTWCGSGRSPASRSASAGTRRCRRGCAWPGSAPSTPRPPCAATGTPAPTSPPGYRPVGDAQEWLFSW